MAPLWTAGEEPSGMVQFKTTIPLTLGLLQAICCQQDTCIYKLRVLLSLRIYWQQCKLYSLGLDERGTM